MVKVTPEQILRERAAAASREASGEIEELDRLIVGGTCRLDLPLTSVHKMRQVAELLNAVAERFDFLSRRDDLPPKSVLLEAMLTARAVNKKLRELRPAQTRRKGGAR